MYSLLKKVFYFIHPPLFSILLFINFLILIKWKGKYNLFFYKCTCPYHLKSVWGDMIYLREVSLGCYNFNKWYFNFYFNSIPFRILQLKYIFYRPLQSIYSLSIFSKLNKTDFYLNWNHHKRLLFLRYNYFLNIFLK